MAHFYGEVSGSRGAVSRLGGMDSGMRTVAASWQGAVSVQLYHDKDSGLDMARVTTGKWNGCGSEFTLYDGPVDPSYKLKKKKGKKARA